MRNPIKSVANYWKNEDTNFSSNDSLRDRQDCELFNGLDEVDDNGDGTENDDDISGSRNRWGWWDKSYIGDYLIVCFCFGLVGILYFFVPPFQRYLPISNTTDYTMYPYPYEQDLVPGWSLSIICFVGPILCFLVLQYWRRSPHDFHTTVLGLFEALALTLLATEALKLASGEYRPDYISIIDDGEPTKIVKDAKQSFPSGHSSLSFCAMSYMSMWLLANLGGFHKKSGGVFWKSILSLLPLIVAFFVAISRVDNYRHDFVDITAGGMIGSAFAVYCWLLNYPPPSSSKSAIPKSRKTSKEFDFFDDSDRLIP